MENPKMILFDYGQTPVNGAIVMDYRYKILHVNKEERWITISSDDDLYLEELSYIQRKLQNYRQ